MYPMHQTIDSTFLHLELRAPILVDAGYDVVEVQLAVVHNMRRNCN